MQWEAEHLPPKGLFVGLVREVNAHVVAIVKNKDAVGERQKLRQFRRDQQDGCALCAQLQQRVVDDLDGTDTRCRRALDGRAAQRGVSGPTDSPAWKRAAEDNPRTDGSDGVLVSEPVAICSPLRVRG